MTLRRPGDQPPNVGLDPRSSAGRGVSGGAPRDRVGGPYRRFRDKPDLVNAARPGLTSCVSSKGRVASAHEPLWRSPRLPFRRSSRRLGAVADERDAWAALVNGSHVALVRHGSAPPGYGDPPGFKIDDCATQRNMDERGRAQARAVGEAFRQHGVPVDKILSSPWCRCLETARLMALGPVESVMAVASSERSPERLVVLKEMVAAWRGPGTLVLVTHAFTVQRARRDPAGAGRDRGGQAQAWRSGGNGRRGQDRYAQVTSTRRALSAYGRNFMNRVSDDPTPQLRTLRVSGRRFA